MKKSIFFIICFLSIFLWKTNAFFWDPSSLDLYKNIDLWVEKLEDKLLENELNGSSNISNEINKLALLEDLPECLNWDISITEMKEIIEEEKSGRIYNYMVDCRTNWKVPLNLFTNYIELFKVHYYNSKIGSTKKSNQINKMSNLWIFSDWILENSWFDLITDIQNINEIIFSEKIDYEWEEEVDIESIINLWEKTKELQPSPYKKVTDNEEFPCENFFCINIDFIKYDDDLWWPWDENTIEFLINRSNEHLREFVFKSMVQAKMPTGQFELWLKDLKFSDIFHLSVQVSYKPIPILKIEKAKRVRWHDGKTSRRKENSCESKTI